MNDQGARRSGTAEQRTSSGDQKSAHGYLRAICTRSSKPKAKGYDPGSSMVKQTPRPSRRSWLWGQKQARCDWEHRSGDCRESRSGDYFSAGV